MSRVTRGLVTLEKESIDLRSVITAAAEQSLPLIDGRRHELRMELPEVPVMVHADRVRLTQVFCNLLNNAAKYTPPGGSIRITIVESGPDDGGADRVEVDVVDSGEGIDAALLPQVFELFSQGKRTPDRAQGGLGIGLSLAKTLVDLHGGTTKRGARSRLGRRFMSAAACGGTSTLRQTHRPRCRSAVDPTAHNVVDDNVDAASPRDELELDGHPVVLHTIARRQRLLATAAPTRCCRQLPGIVATSSPGAARATRGRLRGDDAVTGYGRQRTAPCYDAGFNPICSSGRVEARALCCRRIELARNGKSRYPVEFAEFALAQPHSRRYRDANEPVKRWRRSNRPIAPLA